MLWDEWKWKHDTLKQNWTHRKQESNEKSFLNAYIKKNQKPQMHNYWRADERRLNSTQSYQKEENIKDENRDKYKTKISKIYYGQSIK